MTQTTIATRPPAGAPADRTRFPCFNGYRAIAAMGVLLFHAGFFGGYTFQHHPLGLATFFARLDIGVSIFFLVSGFLLYRPFVAAHFARRPAPDVRSYVRRRALRILPAYWAALTVIAFVLDAAPDVKTARGFALHYGLVQIYVPGRAVGGLAQTWSLATELSFYAFLPLYAWFLGRRPRAPRRQLHAELAGVATLYATSFVFRLFAETFFPTRPELKLWLLSTTDLFALGMGIAVVSAWYATRPAQPRLVGHRAFPAVSWALAAVAFWAVAIPLDMGLFAAFPFDRIDFAQELARQALYGIAAGFLLLPGVFGPQGRGAIRRFLASRVMQFLGLVSYGVFLWHLWVNTQVRKWLDHATLDSRRLLRTAGGDLVPFPLFLALVVVLSVALAAASYALVERPFLRLKARPNARRRAVSARH
jgi:peptidoglycan/LPS O-acetylase OafA/YrhL